jgi:polyvinyl alcohol dehydrogenase (cytochrome)
VWSSPAVDLKRGVVYITTGDAYSDPAGSTSDAFMAFDIKTGKLLWTRQVTSGDAYNVACGLPEALRVNCPDAKGPDHDFGSSPMLVDLPNGRRALIAGQKSGVVHAVDPDRGGEILWQTRVGKGSALGGIQWGTAYDGRRVYVALSDVIPETAGTALAPPAPPTPPGQAAQPSQLGGGLYALDPASGQIVWTTPHPGCDGRPGCSPAQSAAVTAIPGIVFSGGIDGHLRAYASDKGAIVWDVDTAQPYKTVNGVTGNGGSLDGPGPIVVGGMLFVNSGYAFVAGKPGNVLLAFSVDGK